MSLVEALNQVGRDRLAAGEPLVSYLGRVSYVGMNPVAVGSGVPAWGTRAVALFRPSLSLGIRFAGWLGLAYTVYQVVSGLRTGGTDAMGSRTVGSITGLPSGTAGSVSYLVSSILRPGLQYGRRAQHVNGLVSLYRQGMRAHGAYRRLRRRR